MKEISCMVRTAAGASQKLLVRVESIDELYSQLEAKGETLLRIMRMSDAGSNGVSLSGKELLELFETMAALTGSGLKIQEAVEIAVQLPQSEKLGKAISDIHALIQKGQSFSTAFTASIRKLPALIGGMLEVGERTGRLDQVLQHCLGYMRTMQSLREKMSSAALYPGLVMSLMLVAVTALALLLPSIQANLGSLSGSGGAIQNGLDRLRGFLLVLIVILATPVVAYIVYKFGKPRNWTMARFIESTFMRLPIAGVVSTTSQLFSLAFTMEVLTGSGIPLHEALKLSANTMWSMSFKSTVARAAQSVKEGAFLSHALGGSKHIPVYFIRWVGIAERTGKPGQMFGQLRGYYQRQLDVTIARISGLIEPVLIVAVGGLLLTIVSMVVLPMFSSIYTMGPR